jgi:signal transduction histidine kinase
MFSVKALFPVFIAIHLTFATLVYATFKNDRSAKFWMAGCLFAAAGFSLILTRGSTPFWLSFELANFLILVAWFLFFSAIEILLVGSSKALKWSLPIGFAYVVGLSLIADSQYKNFIATYVGATWALVNLFFYFALQKLNRNHQNKFVKLIAYLHLCSSSVWLIRIAFSWIFEFNFVLDNNFTNWITMLSNLLLVVMRQLTYLGIRYDLVREEKSQVERLLVEREKLIASLLKANKTAATGALSASIAHELNQPLGASNLNIQFLKRKLEKGALNPEIGKDVLDSLEKDNQRAASIVKSLGSIFTEGDPNAQAVQLGDLISKVLDFVGPELKSKNIQIQLRVEEPLLIKVNPTEIEQVILNLINNAAQALANSVTLQRHIVIEAVKVDKLVQLSISDNGAGVPADFKSQLFELLSTTKRTGMGLGLWLCKHIVTRYCGSIHYEEVVVGGAKFVVQLPSEAY